MLTKRAQLSVETMIIYGLIILVALSVVGGLIYFNVLDIGSYLPDSCSIGGAGDLKCEEMRFSASDNIIELGIRNLGQKPISFLSVSVTDTDELHFPGKKSGFGSDLSSPPKLIDGSGTTLAPGDIAKVTISTGTALSGKTLKGTMVTKYKYKNGAITQEASGNIRIKAS